MNDDGSVGIGITMNGSIPHWGAEAGHWAGGDVSLEAHGDLLLRKNDDGEYVLAPDNDYDITSRISFDPRETVEDFKSGVNDIDDLDEDDDDGWVDANDEAIRANLNGLSDDDCDYYFGTGTSKWIQGPGVGAVDTKKLEAEARETEARRRVAEDPNTPADVLAKLSTDSFTFVREHVAMNPNTPADVLARMSTDFNSSVRWQAAMNPNTPANVLARMSTDFDEYLRRCVAIHPNTPPDSLIELSTDSDSDVRCAVAYNPNTPLNVVMELANDKDSYIRRRALENLEARRQKNDR